MSQDRKEDKAEHKEIDDFLVVFPDGAIKEIFIRLNKEKFLTIERIHHFNKIFQFFYRDRLRQAIPYINPRNFDAMLAAFETNKELKISSNPYTKIINEFLEQVLILADLSFLTQRTFDLLLLYFQVANKYPFFGMETKRNFSESLSQLLTEKVLDPNTLDLTLFQNAIANNTLIETLQILHLAANKYITVAEAMKLITDHPNKNQLRFADVFVFQKAMEYFLIVDQIPSKTKTIVSEEKRLQFWNNVAVLKRHVSLPSMGAEEYVNDLITVLELLKQKEILTQKNLDHLMEHPEFLQRFAKKISNRVIHSQIKNQTSFDNKLRTCIAECVQEGMPLKDYNLNLQTQKNITTEISRFFVDSEEKKAMDFPSELAKFKKNCWSISNIPTEEAKCLDSIDSHRLQRVLEFSKRYQYHILKILGEFYQYSFRNAEKLGEFLDKLMDLTDNDDKIPYRLLLEIYSIKWFHQSTTEVFNLIFQSVAFPPDDNFISYLNDVTQSGQKIGPNIFNFIAKEFHSPRTGSLYSPCYYAGMKACLVFLKIRGVGNDILSLIELNPDHYKDLADLFYFLKDDKHLSLQYTLKNWFQEKKEAILLASYLLELMKKIEKNSLCFIDKFTSFKIIIDFFKESFANGFVTPSFLTNYRDLLDYLINSLIEPNLLRIKHPEWIEKILKEINSRSSFGQVQFDKYMDKIESAYRQEIKNIVQHKILGEAKEKSTYDLEVLNIIDHSLWGEKKLSEGKPEEKESGPIFSKHKPTFGSAT